MDLKIRVAQNGVVLPARLCLMASQFETLRNQLVAFVQNLRGLDLKKLPAVSETIDWARTLLLMHADRLDPDLVRTTLNVILKFQDDVERVDTEVNAMVRTAREGR